MTVITTVGQFINQVKTWHLMTIYQMKFAMKLKEELIQQIFIITCFEKCSLIKIVVDGQISNPSSSDWVSNLATTLRRAFVSTPVS